MPQFLFVGERPSPTAAARGFNWLDGRLAAKQLFDALRVIGINPHAQTYLNVFRSNLLGPEVVNPYAVRQIRRVARTDVVVVAMGAKVAGVLTTKRIPHLRIVHPAARGRIRLKARYARHVRVILLPLRV